MKEECRAIANNIALYGDGGKVAGKLVSACGPPPEAAPSSETCNSSNCAYFERRKVNSMDPSFQLRPPSLDVSNR